MNNHQNAIFHQITNFLKTPLALLGVDLKNFQFNKICHFANHPYLCKGLMIYENNLITVEIEPSEIPWVKVFAKRKVKEFSECTLEEKTEFFRVIDIAEKLMLNYFNADKINIASFGNMLPQVHWHVMARFELDSYFPEPMWGEKQRDAKLELLDFETFFNQLKEQL